MAFQTSVLPVRIMIASADLKRLLLIRYFREWQLRQPNYGLRYRMRWLHRGGSLGRGSRVRHHRSQEVFSSDLLHRVLLQMLLLLPYVWYLIYTLLQDTDIVSRFRRLSFQSACVTSNLPLSPSLHLESQSKHHSISVIHLQLCQRLLSMLQIR